MITLKNGFVVPYNKDFDVFCKDLMASIVTESRKSAESRPQDEGLSPNELFLKEVMDNCIFVTHQLFEIAKEREDFSRFIITGFLFNSIICCLPTLSGSQPADDPKGQNRIH
ncbi:MAG: hypothetical protein A2W19_16035 [Spirochaetes bacterium RBG_16_49_21]|nr:MAG: hypothetical protein A2W19_16035 [Spirochaetes bacterium RBG_16_49_21]